MSRRPPRYLSAVPSVPISVPTSIPRAYYLQDEDFSEGEMEPRSFIWQDVGEQSVGQTAMRENSNCSPTPDVTELYRRKPEDHYVISQEVVIPDEPRYYYRPAALARLPQRRLPLSTTPSGQGGTIMPHSQNYYHPPHEEPRRPPAFDGIVYRSSPHLHRSHQMVAESPQQVPSMIRTVRPPSKPAVTVRTPRYYRRASLCKRPSALCLPLTSEPDPCQSVSRPIKTRLPSTIPGLLIPSLNLRTPRYPITTSQKRIPCAMERYRLQTAIEERKQKLKGGETTRSAPPRCSDDRMVKEEELERVQQIILEHKAMQDYGDDSTSNNGEIDPKCSELELLLNQYEQIFSSDTEPPGATVNSSQTRTNRTAHQSGCSINVGSGNGHAENGSKSGRCSSRKLSARSRVRRKVSSARMMLGGMLKPRLPPSLKGSPQKRHGSKSSLRTSKAPSVIDDDRLEIEQMTAEVLDSLLQDLNSEGLVEESPSMVGPVNSPAGKAPATRSRSGSRSRSSKHNSARTNPDTSQRNKIREDLTQKSSSKTLTAQQSDQYIFPELKSYVITPTKGQPTDTYTEDELDIPTKTTFMQDKDKFTKYINSSHTSFDHDKKSTIESSSQTNAKQNVEEGAEVGRGEEQESEGMCLKENGESFKKSAWTNTKRGKESSGSLTATEDHSAMELHRSKSYIVNLIDRALSRELGTIPEERASKQYLNLDARTAIDLMASPAAKHLDTDMCLEITQAIADSLSSVKETSNAAVGQQQSHTTAGVSAESGGVTRNIGSPLATCCTAKERGEPSNKLDGELMFSSGNDEPLYIKQLKKLRWGHLKHIQREMRRLEDLERFLDSCSSDDK